MRNVGYEVIDLLIDHFDSLLEQPVSGISDREKLVDSLWESIPERPMNPSAVLERLRHDVFGNISHVDHPRFFAFIPSPGNYISALADALVSGFNVFAGTWIASSGPAVIELVTLGWLRSLCGMPVSTGGIFTSGGSVANLTALAVARHVRLKGEMKDAVIYASDQTHSSIDRALRVLGFDKHQLRRLPSDPSYRLDTGVLRRAVEQDRRAGRIPFCVVANAGTTNTGTVDPLEQLAALCQEMNLWMHVDGAYGAAAVLSEKGRAQLAGIERADSLTLDPHKWLFQPYEIGCLLVRDNRWLKNAFHILPEYLRDTERTNIEEVNFADRGIQLTRRFRALKLWLSLKVFGLAAFGEAVSHGIRLAESAETIVREMQDWEVTSPAQLGIVTVRFAPEGVIHARQNELNRQILARINEDGFAMLSSTTLDEKLVIRICSINPRATEDDIRMTLERMNRFAVEIQQAASDRSGTD